MVAGLSGPSQRRFHHHNYEILVFLETWPLSTPLHASTSRVPMLLQVHPRIEKKRKYFTSQTTTLAHKLHIKTFRLFALAATRAY